MGLSTLVGELWRAFRTPPRYTREELDRLSKELDEAVRQWEDEGGFIR